MANKIVSQEDIKKIAYLARLELNEIEEKKFVGEINNILEYVSQIDSCDTNGISETHNLEDYKGSVLQEDIIKSFWDTQDLLSNAGKYRIKQGFIKTSKMVSKK